MSEIEFVQDLIFSLEQTYEEGAIALNEEYGLTPPDDPTQGHAALLKARSLGIAMHQSLLSLDGRALHAELTVGIDSEVVSAVERRWVVEFAKQLASAGLAAATMQVLLIGTALKGIRGSVNRADELVELIRASPLGERASSYMKRATRLFLAGFDEECVIMCACVIEAAYEDRFEDHVMREQKQGRKRGSGWRFDAWEYEAVALRLQVFGHEDGAAAARLREARNNIVHLKPDAYLPALDSLKICATLLDRLFPRIASQGDDVSDHDFVD